MRRRWSVVALAAAAVLLFGYVATHRDPVRRPDPPRAAEPTPSGLPRVTGERVRGPEGLKLLVSGQYPQIIDTFTGHSGPVPGVQLSAGERAAVQVVPAGTVYTEIAPSTTRSHTTLVPLTGARHPIVLGYDVAVVPALRGSDLYVAARGPGSTKVTVTAASGRPRTSWTAGGALTPLRDTAAGLVVRQLGDRGVAELRVLDPRTGAVRRRIAVGGIVVAVGPVSVAYVPADCRGDCPLSVATLADGRTRRYPLPPDTGNPAVGSFAPDGRRLALGVPGQYRGGRLIVVPGFAEVLDLTTGEFTRIPGLDTAAERAPDLSWSGDTLVLAAWSGSGGQVGIWSADRRDQLRVLRTEPPGDAAFSSVTVLPP
jgi:hypothetical protein